MDTLTIYGSSDDLIEVEGAIREEFNCDKALLAFSDGTVVSVAYDEHGFWRINRIAAGSAEFSKVEAVDADGDDYSDRATLTGDIRWVVQGSRIVQAR